MDSCGGASLCIICKREPRSQILILRTWNLLSPLEEQCESRLRDGRTRVKDDMAPHPAIKYGVIIVQRRDSHNNAASTPVLSALLATFYSALLTPRALADSQSGHGSRTPLDLSAGPCQGTPAPETTLWMC